MANPESIATYGEILTDRFSQIVDNRRVIEDKFGGAPANTAIGLARLGAPVSFIGKVGQDVEGKSLVDTLNKYGVDTRGVIVSPTEKTTIAFVTLDASGDRSFTFAEGAHGTIAPNEVSLPERTPIFHFGSLTQIHSPSSEATEILIKSAIQKGAIISYDPNIREALWVDLERARETVLETIKRVHILKVNLEEALLLSQAQTVEQAADTLFTPNLQALIITTAERGCYYRAGSYEGNIPAIPVAVVDTTGAGDAFNAGFLYGLYRGGKQIPSLSAKELEAILRRAVVIGSLTTTKKGAISAFPTLQEIESHL